MEVKLRFWNIISKIAYQAANDSAQLSGFVYVNMHYFFAGVDVELAERNRQEILKFIDICQIGDRDSEFQSYRFLQKTVGGRDMALKLFAIGKVLGFWDVITPEVHGLTGAEADLAAEQGYIAISRFHPKGDYPVEAQSKANAKCENGEYFLFDGFFYSGGNCFKCGTDKPYGNIIQACYLPSLTGWVSSKEVAERIVAMFGQGAYYKSVEKDSRTHLIVITSCSDDKWRLKKLAELIQVDNTITIEKIAESLL